MKILLGMTLVKPNKDDTASLFEVTYVDDNIFAVCEIGIINNEHVSLQETVKQYRMVKTKEELNKLGFRL